MKEILVGSLLLIGAAFTLLAAVGVMRMPDVYVRMQAATKAATFGIITLMLGVAAHFADAPAAMTAGLVIVFFLLTAPVAAHVIGRAAYFAGVELWHETVIDELADKLEGEREAQRETGGPSESVTRPDPSTKG